MNAPIVSEPPTIGLSEKSHILLKRLKDDGYFSEMVDGYRFGISLALSRGVIPDEVAPPKTTIFNIGTLDPERAIYKAIQILMDTQDVSVYRWAERLAEWGIIELARRSESGEIDFSLILQEAEQAKEA